MRFIFYSSFIFLILVCSSCNNAEKTKVSDNNLSVQQQSIDADNKLLKVFETGDVSMLDSIISPRFVNHSGMGDKVGLDSQRAMVKSFHSHVNNIKMELKRQWADSNYVADWVKYTGTNPDVEIEGIEVTSYSDGKAVEHWFFPSNRKN